jgi:hypothetical protein
MGQGGKKVLLGQTLPRPPAPRLTPPPRIAPRAARPLPCAARQETLLGRLDALLPRETVKECLTGSSSGLAFAPDSAALASDGAVSLVIMGDVNLMEEEAADGLTDREVRAAAAP